MQSDYYKHAEELLIKSEAVQDKVAMLQNNSRRFIYIIFILGFIAVAIIVLDSLRII